MFKNRYLFGGLSAFALLAVSGCAPPNEYQAPPAPEVTVARPIHRDVTVYLEETGTTEPVQVAQVRARVRGFLDAIKFTDGEDVKEGQILYEIEKAQYTAAVQAAEADVSANEAELEKAKIEADRQEKLDEQSATSETAVVAARAARDEADAAIQAAKANLAQAKLNLSYTDVKAPITGRVGMTLVKRGNLVSGTEATHLTTVMEYDPIYATFYINETQLLSLAESRKGRDGDNAERPQIDLRRQSDDDFVFRGEFDYADLQVDQSTGTYMIRGIFPNPDLQLVPGLFVRVRIAISKIKNAQLIPEYSVMTDQAGKYVFVVNSKSEVERRDVRLGPKHVIDEQPFVVIEGGVKDTDLVVIQGTQRTRAGGLVRFTEQNLDEQLAQPSQTAAAQTPKDTSSTDTSSTDTSSTDTSSTDTSSAPTPAPPTPAPPTPAPPTPAPPTPAPPTPAPPTPAPPTGNSADNSSD